MLTCKQLTERATDYLEGQLSLSEHELVRTHLDTCGGCQAFLRQLEATVRLLPRVPTESISPEHRNELLARFREMRTRERGAKAALTSRCRPRIGATLRGGALGKTLADALGGGRGWVCVGFFLVVAALMVAFLCTAPPRPLMVGIDCLPGDLITLFGSGLLPVAALVFLARRTYGGLPSGVYAAAASLGAFGGYVWLQFNCGMALEAPHVVVFHVGGILAATATGAAASRLPAVR